MRQHHQADSYDRAWNEPGREQLRNRSASHPPIENHHDAGRIMVPSGDEVMVTTVEKALS